MYISYNPKNPPPPEFWEDYKKEQEWIKQGCKGDKPRPSYNSYGYSTPTLWDKIIYTCIIPLILIGLLFYGIYEIMKNYNLFEGFDKKTRHHKPQL